MVVIEYLIYSYYHRKRARNTPNRKEGDLHFVFFCFFQRFCLGGGGEKQDACYGYERELSAQPQKPSDTICTFAGNTNHISILH